LQIPKNIEIRNAVGKTVAFLSPQADGLKDVYADCRLNAESTLEFLLPANSPKLSEITPECQIWANNKVYNILKPDAIDVVRDENNKLWVKYMAVERWNELNTKYNEPYISNDPNIPVPANLAVIIVGGGSDLSGGLYQVGTAAHAMYAVLNGSGWSVGTVDVTGIHDLEAEKISRLELIKTIQEIWGGYIVWDSVNKTVSLRSNNTWQNYTGFQIKYKKNLKNITRTQSNRIITKLYPFGKDDLDIASVNGGVKYLVNNSYTANEYIGIYRNPDIENAQELKDIATVELALNCHPRYLYRVKIVDARVLPEYSHEYFAVGDLVDVIDPDVAPESPKPRIIRYKYNIFRPWECELELGDPEERFVESLKASFDTSSFVGSVFNSSGRMSGYNVQDATITNAKITNLEANKITTNEAKITTAQIESLIVGTNVIMGASATISWSQVTDQPTIPTLPSYIKSTYIDATTVMSPTIVGGTITGGSITSNSTITVETDAIVGNALRLYKSNLPYAIFKNDSTSSGEGILKIGQETTIGSGVTNLKYMHIYAGELYVYKDLLVQTSIKKAGYEVATENYVATALSNYYTKTEIGTILSNNYYTKAQTDEAIDSVMQDHLDQYHGGG